MHVLFIAILFIDNVVRRLTQLSVITWRQSETFEIPVSSPERPLAERNTVEVVHSLNGHKLLTRYISQLE